MRIFKVFIFFVLVTGFSFAQSNTTVKGNTVSLKEVAPIWPGCENSESTKKCFNTKMNSFIKENFSYSKNAKGEWVTGKSTVSFSIDQAGKVKNVKAEGPEAIVNREVERLVKTFPEMKPGKRGEKPVAINYKMAFNF